MSEGPFASLNLGRKSGDDPERVDENRRIACEALGADLEKLALNYQVHSARVRASGAGDVAASTRDGLWTRRARPADAGDDRRLPADRARARPARSSRPSRVLHAGWRGLLAGIVAAGVARARRRGTLTAAIGPASARAATRWGRRSRRRSASASATTSCASGSLDLWTSAERALRAAGVEHVERFDRCTACEPETFFSHRRDAGRTGRQGVIAYVAG